MNIFNRNIVLSSSIFFLFCVFSASAQKVDTNYTDENSAVLFVEKTIQIVSFDFKKNKYSSVKNGYYKVFLPPGEYNLELTFRTDWRPGSVNTTFSSANAVTVPFSALKNQTSHLINADVLSTSFRPRVRKGLPISELLKKYEE